MEADLSSLHLIQRKQMGNANRTNGYKSMKLGSHRHCLQGGRKSEKRIGEWRMKLMIQIDPLFNCCHPKQLNIQRRQPSLSRNGNHVGQGKFPEGRQLRGS